MARECGNVPYMNLPILPGSPRLHLVCCLQGRTEIPSLDLVFVPVFHLPVTRLILVSADPTVLPFMQKALLHCNPKLRLMFVEAGGGR